MARIKTSKKLEISLQKPKIDLELEDFKGLRRADPLKELIDPCKTAMAVFECLLHNDPEGAMEMIEIYLEALNKASLRKQTNLPKSTMYSALKHRNPTIKTLAKIMYSSTHFQMEEIEILKENSANQEITQLKGTFKSKKRKPVPLKEMKKAVYRCL